MFCGYLFDHEFLGKYGCANCEGEGLDSYSERERLERERQARTTARTIDRPSNGHFAGEWETEPDVGRVADGVAARVDRLKAIGNGQVPQCAALVWELLK
jgi:DNA (cytosine-5)-methyltransferase 1